MNPLAAGRLTPYRDRTAPKVLAVSVRGVGSRKHLVRFLAESIDTPARPVPGRWNGFPVTPARVTWRIERNGRVVVPTTVARDVLGGVPRNHRFWTTYARGTHQNWPVFSGHKLQGLRGRYLFRLNATAFDARSLRNGTYELVVTARDTAGNRGAYRIELLVNGGTVELGAL